MAEITPIHVEIEQEDDNRILASVPDLPGVMAYGATEAEAIRKVKSIALLALADMIESGEEVPEPLNVLFADRPSPHVIRQSPNRTDGDVDLIATLQPELVWRHDAGAGEQEAAVRERVLPKKVVNQ